MSNENKLKEPSVFSLVMVVLGVLALIAAKFLWALTAWYEWIALGVAFIFLAAGGVFANKHGTTMGKKSDDEETI